MQRNAWRSLRHRLDHAPDLLEELTDLRLADDERRRERERIADRAEHEILTLEATHHRIIAAPPDRVGARGEIDPGRDADTADVEHARQALQTHGSVGPDGLEFLRALEQALGTIEIECRQAGRAGERMCRIG